MSLEITTLYLWPVNAGMSSMYKFMCMYVYSHVCIHITILSGSGPHIFQWIILSKWCVFVHNQRLLWILRWCGFSGISVPTVVLIKRWFMTVWCVRCSWRSQCCMLLQGWCTVASTYRRKILHSCIDGEWRGVSAYANRKYSKDIILDVIEGMFWC